MLRNSCTRRNIAELIDHNEQFTDRAIDLSKNFKMDFEIVRNIQGRTITLGDILANIVPVNTFGQIISYFDTLLGKPVRSLLEKAVDRWDSEVTENSTGPIIDDFDALARSLTRLFEVRHILCHETPKKLVYEAHEIDEFLDRAIHITKALDEVLTFEKFGLVPLTQAEMNIFAGQELKNAEEELDRLFSEIETKVKDIDIELSLQKIFETDSNWLQYFKDAQEKWLSYRNAQCEFETYINQGGSIRPLLWASEAKRLTELRIGDFKSWLRQNSEIE